MCHIDCKIFVICLKSHVKWFIKLSAVLTLTYIKVNIMYNVLYLWYNRLLWKLKKKNTILVQGRIQDFKLGGGALKKIAPSGGRRENCLGISCEKSRFYSKKSYFFQLRREARKFLGYFVWKITILRQKMIFFPILGGARAWIRPC